MTTATVPIPLRVLYLSDSQRMAFWRRRLGNLDDRLEVVSPSAAQLPTYLGAPHYYHILQISAAQWTALSTDLQQAIGQKLSFVVIAPNVGRRFPTPPTPAWVHLLPEAPSKDMSHLLIDFYTCLLQKRRLTSCAQTLSSYWQFHGDEACWPESPVPQTTSKPLPPEPGPVSTPSHSNAIPAVAIGHIDVHGDLVQGGGKIVLQSQGDQTIRGRLQAAKIEQSAGGDQININRLSDNANLKQSAGGDQVNVNRLSQKPDRELPVDIGGELPTCPNCGRPISKTAKFCMYCGQPLTEERS